MFAVLAPATVQNITWSAAVDVEKIDDKQFSIGMLPNEMSDSEKFISISFHQ